MTRVSAPAKSAPLAVLMATLLVGCASQPPAPIDGGASAPRAPGVAPAPSAPPVATTTVRKGDTLYAIAFARGLDFHDIARWNGIGEPYTIYPGQVLRLGPAASDTPVTAHAADTTATVQPVARDARVTVVERVPAPAQPAASSKPVFVPLSEPGRPSTNGSPAASSSASAPAAAAVAMPSASAQDNRIAVAEPARPVNAPAPVSGTKGTTPGSERRVSGGGGSAKGGWQWPTDGRILEAFGAGGRKGIVVGGDSGQVIRAARAGEVVYAGGGLLGYGLLVIVKHDDTYLSAYGNNSRLLVKEGARVDAGQGIAEMGASADGRVGLHFELRRKGQPIDPLTLVKAP